MRLVRLEVKHFQCIEEAVVELGPGLNVLYGPNDLGKSSLAWALRAVLLLQHNSSQHQRFVSWYGDTDPRVSLTFVDAKNRYWRVTKTFGGSAGRSLLEASKDGVTFSSDATGRQVDEKLRKLLGWGIPAPGGAGGSRGFPDSFLAQVLLSEQDSVRAVLFDTSLTKDADESGRLRLTEALGALAQDPLFKKILDDAQANVDRAFTATGRRKKSAGSPFLALTERIKRLQEERDDLDAKVRDTNAAELRIRELVDRRDETARALDDHRRGLVELRTQLELASRANVLREQLARHEATLEDGEDLEQRIEAGLLRVGELEQALEAGTTELTELTAVATDKTRVRDAARAHLDSLSLINADSDTQQRELEQRQRDTQAQLNEAMRAADHALAAERTASSVAESLAALRAELLPMQRAADAADRALAEASTAEAAAQRSLEMARQRLRDATGGEQERARELRRQELENRRLVVHAELRTQEDLQKQVARALEAAERARAARAGCDALARELVDARATVDDADRKVSDLRAQAESLRLLAEFGRLCAAEQALADATAATARATSERERAAALRADAERRIATVRANLPDPSHVDDVRRLHDELRIAEAALGGGLSITIRPRRELAVRATADDQPAVAQRTTEPVALTANRSLAVTVDDLVDIEIVAGEEAARTRAAQLRARWANEGASLLEALGVRSLVEVDELLASAEATRRAAEEVRREAAAADQRAASTPTFDIAELSRRVEELARAVGDVDREDASRRLAALGERWERTLQQQITALEAEYAAAEATRGQARDRTTRIETKHEADAASAVELEATARDQGAALPGPADQLQAQVQQRLRELNDALAGVDKELVTLAGAPPETTAAQAEVASTERALAAATERRAAATETSQRARDELVQARARVDMAQTRARELDGAGVWVHALDHGEPLDVSSWTRARLAAEQQRRVHEETLAAVREQIEALVRERARAVHTAREALERAQADVTAIEARASERNDRNRTLSKEVHELQLAVAEHKATLAALHVDAVREQAKTARHALAALGAVPTVDAAHVQLQEQRAATLEGILASINEELSRAKGALEQVGGAIIREQLAELDRSIQREERREHELIVEFDAWKLLVDTLRETESTADAHLGRALAGPVTERFRSLTNGRYGALELGVDLSGAGLHIEGATRDPSLLSAGTQDQLATLLRLCVAEQLKSGIVLDDHLSQSDPERVAWFNSVMRAAAHTIQIVFITCRPFELLTQAEMPAAGEDSKVSVAGQVRAIDLVRLIKRFGGAASTRVRPNAFERA